MPLLLLLLVHEVYRDVGALRSGFGEAAATRAWRWPGGGRSIGSTGEGNLGLRSGVVSPVLGRS